jgi:predicted Zn finger-like uncharacterized protein
MFTRCPQCKTVHPLTAALISHARGLVQCGQCGRAFSALSFLFDDWPSGRAHGPANGPNAGPPVLGTVKNANAAGNTSAEDHEPDDIDEIDGKSNRLAWGLAMALLIVLTIANTAWTFREPLLENHKISAWTKQAGWLQAKPEVLLKDPQQLQLVSRDIHTHPTRSGILILSLTFVNLAQRSQVFPDLELTLLDATNQPVARRRLQPTDYLRPGTDTRAGLAADVYLPVLLELGDPGNQAVGFEIRFL